MRRLLAVAIAVVSAIAIAGAAVLAPGAERPGNALLVELDEWDLTPASATVSPGVVRIEQRNTGLVEHELLIVRTRRAPDRMPVGLAGVRPSLAGEIVFGAEHSHHGGQSPNAGGGQAPAADAAHIPPGQSRTARVRLKPGSYVLLCGIEGHYQAGQRAALTVE